MLRVRRCRRAGGAVLLAGSRGAFLRDNGVLELNGGFRCRGRRCDHCSGLRNTRGDGGVGRSGRALTAWPTAPCGLILAPSALAFAAAASVASVLGAFRWRGQPERSRWPAKRTRRLPRRRSQAALSPCRLRASRKPPLPARQQRDWRRQWRRPSPRPFHPALPRSDPLPQRRRRRCLLGFIGLAGLRRIGLRFGTRVVSALRAVSALASTLASALPSSRALAAASRSLESLRAALSDAALSDAALSRARLSDAACESSERRGAGADCPERDCRCCWRPHCCRPAPRNCRFWQIDRNPAVRTSPARPEKTRLPILLT